ncbi:MAG: hypothetical protein J1E07_10630, partial [Treponema sp.]|nr:hypothetical protein [Treponema sp.]
VTFWMNDTESARGSWGGNKVKTLVAYGIKDDDGRWLITKEDFNDAGITVSNLPSSSHKVMTIDGEKTYPYSQEVDYGITMSEPRMIPSISGKRFTGWDVEFPCASHGTLNYGEGKLYRYMEIYAEFTSK